MSGIESEIEYIDIVDENDVVIREKISRQEATNQSLCSRIPTIMMIDRDTHEVLIQRRAKTVRFKPNAYCSSVCGYALSGETLKQGAEREMVEEMGVSVPFYSLGKRLFVDNEDPDKAKPFMMGVYYGFVDREKINPDPQEVASYEFYTLDQALKLLDQPTDKLHPMLKPALEALSANWARITQEESVA